MDARWAGFLPLALLFGMGFAGKYLSVAHPIRVAVIFILLLIGNLLGAVSWNLGRFTPDTPVFWEMVIRMIGSAGTEVLWLWGFGAGFGISGRRAGLGRVPRLWSTRLGHVMLAIAVILWPVALVTGEVVRAR